MLDRPAGTWWMLLETDTGFSNSRVHHPWIFHVPYSARLAFAHGCPRTRRRQQWDEHPAHPIGHESMCQLNDRGWILFEHTRQLRGDWLDNGYYSCEEPEGAELLAEICSRLSGSET